MNPSKFAKGSKDSNCHAIADETGADDSQHTQVTKQPSHASSSIVTTSPDSPSPADQSSLRLPTMSSPAGESPLSGTFHGAPTLETQPKAIQSLWSRAYESLRAEAMQLVEDYEQLLSRELSEHDNSLDPTVNRISSDPVVRITQLKHITEQCLQRADKTRTKRALFWHEFTAQFVSAMKGLVKEAVKTSPEASLACAGLCILLRILKSPSAAEAANSNGLPYVTSRIEYYDKLERLLWPVNVDNEGQKAELDRHIVDLYQCVLEFLIQTILQLFKAWRTNLWRDVFRYDDWDEMLSGIKDLEHIVGEISSVVNTIASRDTIEATRKAAEQHYENVQFSLSVSIKERQINQTLEDQPINLPMVPEARYDSADVQYSPKCDSNTRIHIRDSITEWAADNYTYEKVFWLVGPAGTGKSTIARTISNSFASEQRLGASYFFRRGERDRNDTARLFPTLATQLAEAIPDFRISLRRSLGDLDRNALEKYCLRTQFEKLLKEPLELLRPTHTYRLAHVIIIDALDECERPEHLSLIIILLSRLFSFVRIELRVLITSRPVPAVTKAFDSVPTSVYYRRLDLEEEGQDETKADISTFLEHRLTSIKERWNIQEAWPEHRLLARLITLSTTPSPLFIYAATLCRFIDDPHRRVHPVEQLNFWLQQCDSNTPQQDQIYQHILHYGMFGSYRRLERPILLSESPRKELLDILGTITLAATPLPYRAIASLLDISESRVTLLLRHLHAILTVPNHPERPVRLLHKSFGDFLVSRASPVSAGCPIDVARTHAMLAAKCIQRMKEALKQDICGLQKADMYRRMVSKRVINKHIPADLKYACLHWVYHVRHSGKAMNEDIGAFLSEHFLHWLEVLSLLGQVSHGATMVSNLLEMTKPVSETPSELNLLLKDASRVISSFESIIEIAPLQIYGALLFFSPIASKVRQKFWAQRKPCLSIQGVKSNWDTHRQILEGHDRPVYVAAFSPDGYIFATASQDKTVRLWDAATGVHRRTLEVHKPTAVVSVAFSPNGQVIAAASVDLIRLWDVATGTRLKTLEGPNLSIVSIAFSPDRQKIASVSYFNLVHLFDVTKGVHQKALKGHSALVSEVAFSPDSQVLATGAEDNTVRLWNAGTGAHLQTLEGHSDFISAVAFSPDGRVLASGSGDTTLRLWDIETATHKTTLEGHSHWIDKIAFSPDGQTIATASEDETVRLWDALTGAHRRTFEGHNGRIRAMVFSLDGKFITIASGDDPVQLWDIETGPHTHTPDGHNDTPETTAFSPDGQVIASASKDKAVRLWDAATGASIQTFGLGDMGNLVLDPERDNRLLTDLEAISLSPASLGSEALDAAQTTSEPPVREYGFSLDKEWILFSNEPTVWLPPEYRPTAATIKERTLFFRCSSGRVVQVEAMKA